MDKFREISGKWCVWIAQVAVALTVLSGVIGYIISKIGLLEFGVGLSLTISVIVGIAVVILWNNNKKPPRRRKRT